MKTQTSGKTIGKTKSSVRVTAAKVKQFVQPYIDKHQPRDFRLVIKRVKYSPLWKSWVVFLDADKEGASALYFVRHLTDIQEMLESKAKKLGMPIYLTVAGNPEV